MALTEFMKLMKPTQLTERLMFMELISDEIGGTYENDRIGVFFIDVIKFQKRNKQWH